jgi:hypothetical protein
VNVQRISQRVLAWFGRLRVAREEIQDITEEAAHLDDGELIPQKDATILTEVLEALKKDADDAIKEITGVTDGNDPARGGEQQG